MLDNFYEKVRAVSRTTGELSETEKAIVLVRVAIEESSREVGVAPTMHLLSKLMTATLGIMAEDEDATLTNLLKDFEVDELTPN
jgi:hypothetical protein